MCVFFSQQIRGYVLNTLASKDPSVCNVVAQTLSQLALLELPRGEWPDLIQNLCAACATTNPDQLRVSALTTLGYICEDIDEASIADKASMILTAVVSNVAVDVKSDSVRKAGIKALQGMVDFLNPVFQVKEQRDFLMQVVMQNCVCPNEEVKTIAFEVLSGIIGEQYPHMAAYMEAVFQLTVPLIKACTEEDDVVKQAIDVWITIADIEAEKALNEEDAAADGTVVEDIDKSRRYVEGALAPLVEALFVPLTKQDPDADEDEWDVSHAAATCLSYMAECVRDKILPVVLPLFTTHANNEQWCVRDAATVAFGSIMQGPSTEALRPYLSDPSLLKLFMDHMHDANVVVRGSTAWTLGRMCQLHIGAIIMDQARFEAVFGAFVQGLQDETRVAVSCAWGLKCMTESIDDEISASGQQTPSPIEPHFGNLVQVLFASGEKPGCPARQRKGTYQTLVSLVHCSSQNSIAQVSNVTVMCLDRIEAMLAATSFPDKKDADELESLISGLMSECVSKLGEQIAPIADRVCAAYLNLYQKGAGAAAQEEAVLGLGTFASALENNGIMRFATSIVPVLNACIQNFNEIDVCKAAIGALGDLARSTTDKVFSQFLSTVMPHLVAILKDPNVDRSLYSYVMSTLGDIAQAVRDDILPHVGQLIAVAVQAMACKVNLDDPDQADFLYELQESCFNFIAGVNSGLTACNQAAAILQHAPGITQCINIAYENTQRPENVSNAIVGAICDLVIAAGPRVKEVMLPGQPWAGFPTMVNTIMQNADNNTTKTNCTFAMEQIQRNMQS